MSETPQIACTLSASELDDREGAWKKLLGSGLVQREKVPGGIRLRAEPGAAAASIQLVDFERECYAWMSFVVTDESMVTLAADRAGEDVLVGMFKAH